MVDALEDAGIPAFGPRADAAIIEASKIFSKNLMAKYHIPTAKYQTFTELAPALAYIEAEGAPIVVKADGLALGKGVIVAQTVAEAQEAVRSMMDGRKFGQAGARVVVEECMTGPEVTVLAFCDGEHLVPMPSSQDHKRAFDGNQGPNTGGMGAISPPPLPARGAPPLYGGAPPPGAPSPGGARRPRARGGLPRPPAPPHGGGAKGPVRQPSSPAAVLSPAGDRSAGHLPGLP